MKLGTFLKTFSVIRWGHRFKDRQALERYQVKALETYREFLQQESPYFKSGIPADFKMNKAFMMEHFVVEFNDKCFVDFWVDFIVLWMS